MAPWQPRNETMAGVAPLASVADVLQSVRAAVGRAQRVFRRSKYYPVPLHTLREELVVVHHSLARLLQPGTQPGTLAPVRQLSDDAAEAVKQLHGTVREALDQVEQMTPELSAEGSWKSWFNTRWHVLCCSMFGNRKARFTVVNSRLMVHLQQFQTATMDHKGVRPNIQYLLPDPFVPPQELQDQLYELLNMHRTDGSGSGSGSGVGTSGSGSGSSGNGSGSGSSRSRGSGSGTSGSGSGNLGIKPGPAVVQLVGMAGIGKSTLALKVALDMDKQGAFPGGTFFLRVPRPKDHVEPSKRACYETSPRAEELDEYETITAMQKQLLTCVSAAIPSHSAGVAPRPQDGQQPCSETLEAYSKRLKAVLNSQFGSAQCSGPCLLVLDDLGDCAGDMLEAIIPSSMEGVVLLTTQVPLSRPTAAEGSGHATARQDTVSTVFAMPPSGETAQQLLERVVGMPLHEMTLSQQDIAGMLLGPCAGHMSTVATVSRLLQKGNLEAAEAMVNGDQRASRAGAPPIYPSLRSSIMAAIDNLPAATESAAVFSMLSHLKADQQMPLPLLALLWEQLHPDKADYVAVQEAAAGSPSKLQELLDDLVTRSLLVCDKVVQVAEYRMHPLIGLHPEWLGPPSAPLPTIEAAQSTVIKKTRLAVLLLGYGREPAVHWAQRLLGIEVDGVGLPVDEYLYRCAQRPEFFSISPPAAPVNIIQDVLGHLYHNSGQYSKAEVFFRNVLSSCPEAPDAIIAEMNLAVNLGCQGNFEKAESFLTQVQQQLSSQSQSQDLALVLSSLYNNLGVTMQETGRFIEAKAFYQRADNICSNLQETGLYTTIISNKAGLSLAKGDLAQAEAYYRQVLDIRTNKLGKNHRDTISTVVSLGQVLAATGKLVEAESLCRQASEMRGRILGKDHPDTVSAISILARALIAQGKLAEAKRLCEDALKVNATKLGPQHPSTATSQRNLAYIHHLQGNRSGAEKLYVQAKETFERVSPKGCMHPVLVGTLSDLAVLLHSEGLLAQAETMCKHAVTAAEKVFGFEHPTTTCAISNLASILHAENKLQAAEGLLWHALESKDAVVAPPYTVKDLSTAKILGNLAELSVGKGALAEADLLISQAVAIVEELLGSQHPDTARAAYLRAKVLVGCGQLPEAEQVLKRAFAASGETVGPQHPTTVGIMRLLAKVQHDLGRFAEAELLSQQLQGITQEPATVEETVYHVKQQPCESLLLHPELERHRMLPRCWATDSLKLVPKPRLWQQQEDSREQHEQARQPRLSSMLGCRLWARQRIMAQQVHSMQGRQELLQPSTLPKPAQDAYHSAQQLHQQGKLVEATGSYQQALAICQLQLGPNHFMTATCMTGLANCLADQHMLREAARIYFAALSVCRKLLGHGPDLATAHYNLAMVYHQLGQFQPAKEHYSRALVLWRDLPKTQQREQHEAVIRCKLGRALWDASKLDNAADQVKKAADQLEKAVETWEKLGVKQYSAQAAVALHDLARVRQQQKQHAKAAELLAKAQRCLQEASPVGSLPRPLGLTTLVQQALQQLQTSVPWLAGKDSSTACEQLASMKAMMDGAGPSTQLQQGETTPYVNIEPAQVAWFASLPCTMEFATDLQAAQHDEKAEAEKDRAEFAAKAAAGFAAALKSLADNHPLVQKLIASSSQSQSAGQASSSRSAGAHGQPADLRGARNESQDARPSQNPPRASSTPFQFGAPASSTNSSGWDLRTPSPGMRRVVPSGVQGQNLFGGRSPPPSVGQASAPSSPRLSARPPSLSGARPPSPSNPRPPRPVGARPHSPLGAMIDSPDVPLLQIPPTTSSTPLQSEGPASPTHTPGLFEAPGLPETSDVAGGGDGVQHITDGD